MCAHKQIPIGLSVCLSIYLPSCFSDFYARCLASCISLRGSKRRSRGNTHIDRWTKAAPLKPPACTEQAGAVCHSHSCVLVHTHTHSRDHVLASDLYLYVTICVHACARTGANANVWFCPSCRGGSVRWYGQTHTHTHSLYVYLYLSLSLSFSLSLSPYYYIIFYSILFYSILFYYIILYYIILYYIVLYYIILYYTISYYVILLLYSIILYCIVLSCIVLHCIILY